jgi:hypothetical protein
VLGVLRGAKDFSSETAEAVATTAGSVVKATADVGGDIGVTAKAAVEGAINGAKEIGVSTADAASAAATGALRAAGEISTAAVEQVQNAVTGVIGGVKVVVQAPFTK